MKMRQRVTYRKGVPHYRYILNLTVEEAYVVYSALIDKLDWTAEGDWDAHYEPLLVSQMSKKMMEVLNEI